LAASSKRAPACPRQSSASRSQPVHRSRNSPPSPGSCASLAWRNTRSAVLVWLNPWHAPP
jgi:hypothetical protein